MNREQAINYARYLSGYDFFVFIGKNEVSDEYFVTLDCIETPNENVFLWGCNMDELLYN